MSQNHRIRKKKHTTYRSDKNYPIMKYSSNYIKKWGLLIAIISITMLLSNNNYADEGMGAIFGPSFSV